MSKAKRTKRTNFEQRLFVEAGFEPLAHVGERKWLVKRVLFQAPYMTLTVPGVEIEKMPNGSTTLKVIGRGRRIDATPVAASAWPV